MATLTTYRNLVGRYIGESDGSGSDSTRDAIINDVILEVSTRYPFLCNQKSATLTITNNAASFPADLDISHIDKVKAYSSVAYSQVSLADLSSASSSDYWFAIDYENSQIKFSQGSSVTFEYYKIPTDLSSSSDSFNFPLPQCIARLSAGQYWQSIEEEPDQAQLNFASGEELFKRAVFQDQKARSNVKINNYISNFDLGFNR